MGKAAESAEAVWHHLKRLEAIGCFGAELEVVPDRVAEIITKNTAMIMPGMGAGPHADAHYLFAEDVLGRTIGDKPRHAKTSRNFGAEYQRLQKERIAAFREFVAHVNSGAYPQPEHVVPIANGELQRFRAAIESVAWTG